jgi:hypothetical protein
VWHAAAVRRIDHVVRAVRDLDEAGERLLRDHGLGSVPGGRHAAWGTANRIVPLGESYLELVAVADPEVARGTAFGRAIAERARVGDRWVAVCLADDDLEGTAARLGLPVSEGARTRPDGIELRWRTAGVDDEREGWLPFFIAWDVPPDAHPGRARVTHRVPVTGIDRVDLAGDPARLAAWVDDADLPLHVAVGDPPGVLAVRLGLAGGGGSILEP